MTIAIFTVLAALTVFWLALPFLRRDRQTHDDHQAEIAVYEDQLAEIERDRERGLIDDGRAKAARIEIERRLLAVLRRAENEPSTAAGARAGLSRVLGLASALAVGVVALGLYSMSGRPDLPDLPYAARSDVGTQTVDGQGPNGDLDSLITQLRARLADNPDDVAGLMLLARSEQTRGRFGAAKAALEQVLALDDSYAPAKLGLAQVLTAENQGRVPVKAARLLDDILADYPDQPEARYLRGLAYAQENEPAQALDIWSALLADTPVGTPWETQLEQAIAQAASETGADVEAIFAAIAAQRPPATEQADAQSVPAGAAPALSEEQRAAMAAMSPEERAATIRDMVDGLAAQLADDPDDLDGWIRLARARGVLGEQEAAQTAYARAVDLAPDNPDVLRLYAESLHGPPNSTTNAPTISDQAAEVYHSLLAVAPNDPEAHWYLGLYALQRDDLAQAREHWQATLDNLPSDHPDHAAIAARLEDISGG
ncbi:MAG: c-type cytochrome biogenesis protein CcmI [Geminicoccaceae bacterium]